MFVCWTHNITDFESNTTYFDQIPSSQFVAREVELRRKGLLDDLPNLLFGLPL